jgi:hypothetical protein
MVAEADVAVLIPVCGAKHEVIDNNVVAYSSHVESRGVIVNLKVKLPTGTKNLERLGRNINYNLYDRINMPKQTWFAFLELCDTVKVL